ncbi:MAG: hypothetical protein IPH72_31365 [Sandaracinaceae bacterium]|nr:hypothetical protein [Sandaracinaceae bacterium]
MAGATPVLALRTEAEGATDDCFVPITVTDRPTVMCPEGPISAPTRRPVVIEATVTDDGAVVSEVWEVVTRPARQHRQPGAPTTGAPRPRRTAWVSTACASRPRTATGFAATCEVTVIGTETPAHHHVPGHHRDDAAHAHHRGRHRRGRRRSAPLAGAWWRAHGLNAGAPRPPDNPRTVFTPDVAGEYTLRLQAQDDRVTEECTTLVRAVATEGLRVEVFWNTNGTDMDDSPAAPRRAQLERLCRTATTPTARAAGCRGRRPAAQTTRAWTSTT